MLVKSMLCVNKELIELKQSAGMTAKPLHEQDGRDCVSVKGAPLFLMFHQYLAQVQWAEKKRRERVWGGKRAGRLTRLTALSHHF